MRSPGSAAKRGLDALAERFVKGSTGGPTEAERASGGSYVVAIASGAGGEQLAEVRIEGLDGYSFTANFLSWAAIRALRGEIEGAGAIGPAQAFGLEAFERGVSESGIKRA